MKDTIINLYNFNLLYAQQLVEDVDSHLMTKSGDPGFENHPAFTLGHLVSGSAMTSRYLGGPYDISKKWEELFKRNGPEDPRTPSGDIDSYPDKGELLAALSKQHQLVEDLILNLDENRFSEPAKWRFSNYLPTLGDLVYFMCVTHESMHLGQLAGWRRSQGLSSALAVL